MTKNIIDTIKDKEKEMWAEVKKTKDNETAVGLIEGFTNLCCDTILDPDLDCKTQRFLYNTYNICWNYLRDKYAGKDCGKFNGAGGIHPGFPKRYITIFANQNSEN